MGKKYLSSINIIAVISLFLLIVIVTEWFSYFLEMLLNFTNLDFLNQGAWTYVAVFAFFLSPFVTFILAIFGKKFSGIIYRISRIVSVPILVIVAIGYWLLYSAYYQYYTIFAPDLSDITPNTGIFGFLGYINEWPVTLLFSTNLMTFLILTPILFMVWTKGTGSIRITSETNLGAMLAAIYLAFRPGAITGVPFRIAILFIVATGFLAFTIIDKNIRKKGDDDGPTNNENETIDGITSQNIPKHTYGGFSILMTFSLSAPALMMNGLLYNSWVWLFLAISSFIAEILRKKKLLAGKEWICLITIVSLATTQVLLTWATIEPNFFSIEPILQCISLFLLGLVPTMMSILLKTKRENKFLSHPIRHFWFYLVSTIGIFLPLVAVLWTPLSSWIVSGLLGIIYGTLILLIHVSKKKRKWLFQYLKKMR
ncbi:MAG: hypothetical protein ACTSRA_19625 [Promethearchaeota archaeon]